MNYEALAQYLISKRYCFIAGTLGNFIVYEGSNLSTGILATVDSNSIYVNRKKAKPELFNCLLSYYLTANVNNKPTIKYNLSYIQGQWKLEMVDFSKKITQFITQTLEEK